MSDTYQLPPDDQDALVALLLRDQGFAVADVTTIRAQPGSDAAPLSSQQRRLWFLYQLDRANPSYVIPGAVRISGRLDAGLLRQSIQGLVDRHESLRTVFANRDGKPRQVVRAVAPIDLVVEDVEVPAGELERRLRDRVADTLATPFDLEAGPLLRVVILRAGPHDHLVLLAMHHIVSDGWSMGVMIRELAELYAAGGAGRPPALAPMDLQYADFAVWQDQWRASAAAADHLAYWKQQLAGLPALELPTDRARPSVMSHRGGTVQLTLDPAAASAVRRFGQDCGATLFMTLLSGFAALLHRYTSQDDLAIGTPSANRNRAELEPLIGFFINALVLRADLSGQPSFRTLIERLRQVSLDAWAHQDLPFEDVVEALQPDRTASQNPLFQVMFVLQNAPAGRLDVAGLTFEPVDVPSTTAKFDLTLYVQESGAGLSLLLEYTCDLFDEATATQLLAHYRQLLVAGIAEPDRRVVDLPLLSAAEYQQVVVRWNDTATVYPREACLQQVFAGQAARTPEAIALRFGPATMTYGELERRSNQLAHRLRGRGAARDTAIGLVAERSFEMIVGMLGILKAGAAYLPLDPAYPVERLRFLIATASVRLVVAQAASVASIPSAALDVVTIDSSWDTIAGESDGPLPAVSGPMDLAYVMFTSGSTGTPKGVAVPHRAVLRLVLGADYVSFAGETLLQFAPSTFDASTFEIWGALLNGGTLMILAPGTPSLADLGRGIVQNGVTTAWLTAGLFHQMVDHELASLTGLRQLIAGGDVLSIRHTRMLLEAAPRLRLVNGFGPTETTTFATCHGMNGTTSPVPSGQRVPIGVPIANSRAYVLDARLAPCPIGVVGELYLAGDGLARGYLGRPEMTAERFIPDPYGSEPGGRIYRTGDRARWLRGGVLEFLGRRDRQVKIRGFRIEAGEIETTLAAHRSVREAVVVAHGTDRGERELVAYVAADDSPEVTPEALRIFLRARLPEYMVPSQVVRLDAMPLTTNGKVDVAALPTAERASSERPLLAPRTADESAVAAIWAEVLRVERVGVHDNFFELGGHSLIATQVVARIRDQVGVEVSLAAVFAEPTVEALAREIQRCRSTGAPAAIQSIPRSAARRPAGGHPPSARGASLAPRRDAPPLPRGAAIDERDRPTARLSEERMSVLKIALVNMPFAALQRPSIALTLLKAVTDRQFGSAVDTSIHYLNQDFGRDYGIDRYQHVVTSIDAHNGGFGDWFFRQEAFPEVPDNSADYFSRYYVQRTSEQELMRAFVAAERPRLRGYLDTLIARHGLDRADLVGFTSMFAQNVASFALARRIKAHNPGCTIVVGGANCEASMGREIANHVEAVDFAFSGPALANFPEFVGLTLAGDHDGRHRLDGVLSRGNRVRAHAPTILQLGIRPTLPEVGPVGLELGIDNEVALDYDGFLATLDANFPGKVIEPALLFETSRGCWWGERAHCTFCGLNSDSMGYRSMAPEKALALIRSLVAYAPRVQRLECVDNIMPKSYMQEVFPKLDTPPGMTIFYEVKADLSEDDLGVLSRAGVKSLQPGIEALATPTLKLMKKGTSGLGNVRFLKSCLRQDVYPEWNLLVGFPGEEESTYATYERDLPLLAHLPPPSGVYPVRFDRFSPYFTKAAEFGLDLHPYDFYSLVYPFGDDSLAKLAYYFIDRNFGAEYATRTARWIGRLRTRIDEWRDRWHGSTRAVLPRLFLTTVNGSPTIHDSRRGIVVDHPLTPLRQGLLEKMELASTAEQLAKACALDVNQVREEIAWFRSQGLVIGEGDRVLSLVFQSEPGLMTCQRRHEQPAEMPALVARARDERRIRRPVLTTAGLN